MTGRGWRPFAAPAAFLLAVDDRGPRRARRARPRRHGPPPARRAGDAHGGDDDEDGPARSRTALYTVRAGDTLAAIAARSGVPLAQLRALNPNLEPTALFIGEKIRLQ